MSSDKDAPERLIDASPDYAAGYGAAMYDVWRRLSPPDHLLSESELRRLIEFVDSCLPNTELRGRKW